MIGGLLGWFCGEVGEGWQWDSLRCSGLVGLRKGPLPVWSAAPFAPGSEKDNESWALTSDLPPFHPVTLCPALGWQEELEPYCHPGKNST